MKQTRLKSRGWFRPITCQAVLQAYVIASLVSTSGLDVLLVLTLGFLLFTLVWQMSEGLANSWLPRRSLYQEQTSFPLDPLQVGRPD